MVLIIHTEAKPPPKVILIPRVKMRIPALLRSRYYPGFRIPSIG
jgi:hypothetical protein